MPWVETAVQRCREQRDQCCYPDGRRCADAECEQVQDRHVWACRVCGREYEAMGDWQYRDVVSTVWVEGVL